jgi:CarboxypepD_reg-like domain/TonB-dependent Receptor Plug Domain
MKNLFLLLNLLLLSTLAFGQTTLKGKVIDEKGNPLVGANIMIKGTYDGFTADAEGKFNFKTYEKDTARLICSFVGFEPFQKLIKLTEPEIELTLKLREISSELNTVTVTAGTFEASDAKKTSFIKPIDIVTTGGGGADITKTMTLLTPGMQQNGESTGMFVRGGSAQEAKILIDGLTVQSAYNTSSPNVAARSRFTPFQFKGMAFSTGGYSAQYGQALSAVLQMNTLDLAPVTEQTISINLAGISYGKTYLIDNQSIGFTANYNNLTPLFSVYPQNIKWNHVPEYINLSTSYRLRPSAGKVFKFDAVYGGTKSGMEFNNSDNGFNPTSYTVKNQNLLLTSTYQNALDKEALWTMKIGGSYSYNFDNMKIGALGLEKTEERTQARITFTRDLGNNSNLVFGSENHYARYGFGVDKSSFEKNAIYHYSANDIFTSSFVESEFYVTRRLAGRVGLRSEYSSLATGANLAPRFSLAYKTGDYSQVSFAGGNFYQTPDYQYYYINKNLGFEKASHLVLNYQIIRNERTFRIETYSKKYENLVREYPVKDGYFNTNPLRFPDGKTDNSGYGYAKGVDVFFRDNKTFKNGQIWVNYSYCDSKRLSGNYLSEAQPSFVSNHNLNVIYKQYIAKPAMTISGTYSYTSGRPYYNPNVKEFLSERTPDVHNTSLWINYLTNIKGNFMVIYFSVDNVLGTQNVYNYQYSSDGKTRQSITPAANRMILVGTFITISKKKIIPEDMRKN